MHRLLQRSIVVAAALLTACGVAVAADHGGPNGYPGQSIRMIIPSTPGGGTDFIARTLSIKLGEATGWNLVPENRAGAAGTLGLTEVARAKPDGLELVVGQTANVSLAPWLMKLGFDPVKDLVPIAIVVEAPMVLSVAADSPFRTWQDFVKAAKARPGQPPNYGTSGIGSVAQVACEVVQERSGFRMQHVPYKGSTPAIADLMGGHLDLTGTSVASALPLLKSGRIRALAVTSARRSAALPDVPTLAEAGYPNFDMVEWYGVFGPAGMSPAVVDLLNREINKVVQRPDVRSAILAQGQEPRSETQPVFASMVKSDSQVSQGVIAKAGIKLE